MKYIFFLKKERKKEVCWREGSLKEGKKEKGREKEKNRNMGTVIKFNQDAENSQKNKLKIN